MEEARRGDGKGGRARFPQPRRARRAHTVYRNESKPTHTFVTEEAFVLLLGVFVWTRNGARALVR